MLTCGQVGSDVYALINELAIRRVEHRLEIHSNESQHLAEGMEVARLRRRFPFVLQQVPLFFPRHHLCRQGVVLASIRKLGSQGSVSVHAHHTEGVTGSRGRKGAHGMGGGIGVGGGIRVGGGNGIGDRNGVGIRNGARTAMETGTGREQERG